MKKYGTGSISFDGSGDYLASPPTPNLTYGTGNFTIEAWVYLTSTGTIRPIVECRSGGGSTAGYAFLVDENNYLNVFSNGFKGTSSSTITGSSWTHVALVRTGTGTNQTTYYINGTASGTITLSGNLTDANTNQTIVGNSLSSGGQFNGYIDDLRITKGGIDSVSEAELLTVLTASATKLSEAATKLKEVADINPEPPVVE